MWPEASNGRWEAKILPNRTDKICSTIDGSLRRGLELKILKGSEKIIFNNLIIYFLHRPILVFSRLLWKLHLSGFEPGFSDIWSLGRLCQNHFRMSQFFARKKNKFLLFIPSAWFNRIDTSVTKWLVFWFNKWPFTTLIFAQNHIKFAKVSSKFCQIVN